MSSDIEQIKKKIIYRSNYRGTKEIDKLLGAFTNKYLNELDYNDLNELIKLLEIDDNNLYNFYNGLTTNIEFEDNKINNFIVGIGINIESDVANDSWIGLKEIDNEVDRSKIIIKIASAFEKIASGKEDFRDWQSDWEKHCVHMHKKITLNLNDSDKVEGIFEGINHNGEMLLSNENGILTFNSGECSVDYSSI